MNISNKLSNKLSNKTDLMHGVISTSKCVFLSHWQEENKAVLTVLKD